jgi:malyl-CoA/(S)-citramalyl-CoA lyase
MTPTKTRLHRSELAVPGSNVRMLDKAPGLGADVVMLDLEDAVAPDEKEQARVNVIDALREQEWPRSSVSVRINGLDTHWCYRDIVDVVEQAGERVDAIVIPKVGGAGDVHLVATLLSQIEAAIGLERKIGLAVLIETAMGMMNVDEIAAACPDRMEAMIFGVADYAASIQSHTASIGGVDPSYSVLTDPNGGEQRDRHWGDQWHYPLSRIAVACRANGLRPIDGPFGDFTDPEGYLAAARRSAVLGYEGKWAIHPSQIPLANEVFTPTPRLVERTRRIVDAMRQAAAQGRGAVSLDGRLIDAASIRMAENLLAKLEQIEARDAQPSSERAAAATASSPGIAACSSEGANGMGMSGIVTRRAGTGPDDSTASATTSAA